MSLFLQCNTVLFSKVSDLPLLCVSFNFMPNLIVILFNLIYHLFYVGFFCIGCV